MRKSNFELLRIIAMFMIVAYHYSAIGVHQWLQTNANYVWNSGTIVNKITNEIFSPGGGVGVAIFFMLTGYFGIYSKRLSIKKVVMATAYYGIVLAVVGLGLMMMGGASIPQLSGGGIIYTAARNVFNPVTSGAYWFVTVYCFVVIISPIINRFYLKWKEKGQLIILIAAYVIEYVWPELDGSGYFPMNRGFFFYLLGAFLRIITVKINMAKIMAVVTAVLCWGSYVFISYYEYSMYSSELANIKLIKKILTCVQDDILIPAVSISLFIIAIKSDFGYKKIINKIAETTFGIYLIHEAPLLRNFIWEDILHVTTVQFTSEYFAMFMIASICAVFIVCAGIDKIRLACVEPWMDRVFVNLKDKFIRKYEVKLKEK